MLKRFLTLAVMLVLMSVPAYAGWVQVEKGGDTTIISHGMIKEMSRGSSHYSVLDAKKGNFMLVDTKRKVYASDTVDNFCKTVADSVKQAMKSMPKEARKAMEKMSSHRKAPPKVSVEKVGDGGTIAGYKTVKYRVLADGRPYQELWLTKDLALTKEMRRLYTVVMNRVSSCTARMSPMAEATPDIEDSAAYRKIESSGWTMKSITRSAMENSSMEVVKLQKKSVPSSEFAPPAGYKKVPLAQMMFQR